jgi:ABC-2 type transport system ATP-binding protein
MAHALTITDLRKTYTNGVEALKGVNLTVQAGDFFALLGPNGAGKTTLIGIVTSLVNKSSGEAVIFDASIEKDPSRAKTYIGVVPQEFNFNIFEKVINIVLTQAGYYGMSRAEALPRAEQLLKDLGLWDKRNTPSQQLSGGMKRRLMIARGLIHNPKLLILDEPTAGVDVEMRLGMWDFLRKLNKEGTTIILTTHYLEEAEELCRNIAIINHGQIVVNKSMQELLDSGGHASLEKIYLEVIKGSETSNEAK